MGNTQALLDQISYVMSKFFALVTDASANVTGVKFLPNQVSAIVLRRPGRILASTTLLAIPIT